MTIWDINPWFLLIAYIPYACCGGFCIILLGTVCYLSDISNEQERGWQLAWMEALISVGILIGILAGPIIFKIYGYTLVFVIATICCILAGLHICFLVPYNLSFVALAKSILTVSTNILGGIFFAVSFKAFRFVANRRICEPFSKIEPNEIASCLPIPRLAPVITKNTFPDNILTDIFFFKF